MPHNHLLDSCVRQAMHEDPQAAKMLVDEFNNFPKHAHRWAELKHMPWAHFVARIRDLHRKTKQYLDRVLD